MRFFVILRLSCLILVTCSPATSANPIPWLYETVTGNLFLKLAGNKWGAYAAGLYADAHIPFITQWHITSFIKKHAVNMNEYVHTDPIHYRTFNDFFTRAIKPSARIIEHPTDDRVITSPADGQCLVIENIQNSMSFTIKGKPFCLEEFLSGNPYTHNQPLDLSAPFIGGTMVIIYLSPSDYHRFHTPCAGLGYRECNRIIKKRYGSVHPTAFLFTQPLLENERHFVALTHKNNIEIMVGIVGALFVNKITYTLPSHIPFKKGQEIGYFSFGGSTVVLLFKPHTFHVAPHLKNKNHTASFEQQWTPIKLGATIGTLL